MKNNDKPPFQGRAIELGGINFCVVVRSLDPDEDLDAMGTLALSLYKRLMKMEGFD